MAATIEVGGIPATIEDYRWSSIDKPLADLLNSLLDPLGPSGADPDPDRTAAQDAIDQIGGRIVSADEVEFKKGRVY